MEVCDAQIPMQAAEAVYSATVQSMVNSAQHAGSGPDVARWLSIRGNGDGGIFVEVGDTGAGFDIDAVLDLRIGLRVSILERMTNAGGHVDVDSAPGEGTVVALSWPSTRVAEPGIEEDHDLAAGAALTVTIVDSEGGVP